MKFELPPLPYAKDALEPHMSRETLEYHYEKHHRGYMDKLQKALHGRPQASQTLEQVIRSSEGKVFNLAAQVWNHTFFWRSMEPKGGGRPGGEAAHSLKEAFGSYDNFHDEFVSAGTSLFGSGYVWLVLDQGQRMRVLSTANARNPLTDGHTPLLACDVWEHAYYLDHRNERAKYLEAFLGNLVNWDRIADQLKKAA